MVYSMGCRGIFKGLPWYIQRVDVVHSMGCHGIFQGLSWYIPRVDVVYCMGCHGIFQGLSWYIPRVVVVYSKGCRGIFKGLMWYIQRVTVVYFIIAKVKSTPSPRPTTGVRKKQYARHETNPVIYGSFDSIKIDYLESFYSLSHPLDQDPS